MISQCSFKDPMFYLLAETSLPVDPSSAPSREYYLWIACCLLIVILPPERYLQTGKTQSLLFCHTSTHFDTLLSSAHHWPCFCFLHKETAASTARVAHSLKQHFRTLPLLEVAPVRTSLSFLRKYSSSRTWCDVL